MIKKIIIICTTMLILFSLLSIYFVYTSFKPLHAEGVEQFTDFTVGEGESLYSVLSRLEEKSLIRNSLVYKLYNRFYTPLNVKKGVYKLSPSSGGLEIMRILEEGRQELIRVTVPEGLRSSQIAELLEQKGITDSQEFIAAVNNKALMRELGLPSDSAEGYLYPDTYYFQKDFPAKQVLAHMVSTFFGSLKNIYPFYEDLSPEKLQEKIILASIVEKEYRVDEEAVLIASVFNNRMKIGMPLQSCATVIYIITEIQGKDHPERIFFRDLEIPSPFNTYINDSLPPGPISNPGRTALNAAFNPAQSDYLFFVVKDSAAGTHTFTSNLADHNTARAAYIQGFRSK
ncbi:MAG: endolytic transglycosylase MltG [Spirochaetales bacterium]|nr:endolytic transglycosylase MltG [Spirochaetales bacterium]